MPDNEQPRLLFQQEDETQNSVAIVRPPWQQAQPEAVPVVSGATQESAEFGARLHRLGETMSSPHASRWIMIEAACWTATLLCLFVWGWWPVSVLLGLLAALTGKYRHLEMRYQQSQMALDLTDYDVKWLGSLALKLESPRPALRPVAAQVLLRVLPRVSAADFATLDSYQRACLYRRLIPNEEINVTLAEGILDTLENVGDVEALRYVERLAYGLAPTAERRHLRSYAEVCMTRIRERIHHEMQGAGVADAMPVAGESPLHAELPPQERAAVAHVEKQLKLLEQEKRKHQQPGMRFGFLIASWCVIVPYLAMQTWNQIVEGKWPEALVLGITTALATQLRRFCLSGKQTEAARKLARHDDIRGVGPLAEALEWPDPDVQSVATEALIRLLPRLQATDGALLTANQRANLYRKLRPYQHGAQTELQQAILRALEQIGDKEAIPSVRRLARGGALSPKQKQVRKAAQDCLPYLRTRAEQQRVSQTLLRASSATSAAPDILLRPADMGGGAAPEQLLRATTDEV
jgi:hypothetical protein